MADLATLTGQPAVLTVDGREYRVHPLTVSDFGALQRWLNDRAPDPLAAIREGLEKLPIEAQKYAIREAMAEARKPKPGLGSPEAIALLGTYEGTIELVYLVIRRGDR